MIRLRRGAEPAALTRARADRLGAAITAWATHQPLVFDGYQCARSVLWERQHHKCAYCERHQGEAGNPVEHFRPKTNAKQENGAQMSVNHYWWLCWTWENLLFACQTCNSGFKNTQFPIEPGQARLPTPPRLDAPIPAANLDLAAEPRLLVDPACDDPLDHLRWIPIDRTLDERAWEWKPSWVTPRGFRTIKTFGLDTAGHGLLAEVTDHIRHQVVPPVCQLRSLVRSAPDAVANAWIELRSHLLHSDARFVAATWCALDELVSFSLRERFNLPHPRP